ncbi:MAG TPA: efflux RND transporter periplasmic adaptor subunit, partial [Candidatus Sumerlaeota bacterium]|nr:efflux RND transporter periplasmic adaptor subunit [Candidatus Sumerlaeota bacterium]
MNKLGTFLGLLILIAGSYGVYLLFQEKTATAETDEPDVPPQVSVQVGKIQKTTLHGYVRAYGSVELDPGSDRTAPAGMRITAPSAGIITDARCVEGQQVNKGDVLF